MFKVEKFKYNGFAVTAPRGGWGQFEKYTATFKEWTNDPGVAVCTCSDNVERRIPTCCLFGEGLKNLPPQNMENKVLFGIPSNSSDGVLH